MSNFILITPPARRNAEVVARPTGTVIPKNADLVLANISGSMSAEASAGSSQYACLLWALAPLEGRVHAIAFNHRVFEVEMGLLREPDGGTNLRDTLQRARTLEPQHVLVISDGAAPDSIDGALEQAAILAEQCIIDLCTLARTKSIPRSLWRDSLRSDAGGIRR
jgi:uncharacterized protein with von Willebrand factor type A (vWA) domain